MLRQTSAVMGLLKVLFVFLWEASLGYPVETIPTWILNPNDQVAVSLVQMFKTNKDYKEREFVMLSNTTKVTSRDAFFIKEFRPACFYMSNKERSAAFGNTNPLLVICNKIEVHELTIDKATGKITGTAELFVAPVDQVCHSVDWSKDLNVYAVFCSVHKENTAGFYHIHFIDGNTKKLTGSVNYDAAGVTGYQFNERTTITAAKIPKGGLQSDAVFIVYDEPFPDFDLNIGPKNNHFIIVVDAELATKKPKSLQVLNLKGETELNPGTFQKFLSFQIMNSKLYAVWFTNSYQATFGRCDFNTAAPAKIELEKCVIFKSDLTFRYGTISFLPSGLIGVFNKHDLKYSVCTFDENNPTNILQGCKNVPGRTDSDVTVENFESYNNLQLAVTYKNKDKSKHIGTDRFTINSTAVAVFNKFKTLADVSRENNGRYYTSIDTFLDAFDESRTEEMVLQAKILFPDKWHKIQVQMIHQGDTTLENYTYFRLDRSVSNISLGVPGGFPKLIGYQMKLFRIPLGREYFRGNAISFNFSAPKVKTIVSNAGTANVQIPNSAIQFVNTFFTSSGLQVISVDSLNKIDIFNCRRMIESDTQLSCDVVTQTGFTGVINVVGMFETPQILMVVADNGQGVGYDKVQGVGQRVSFQATKILSADFKVRDSVIQIALLTVVANGSSVIQVYEWNQYSRNEIYHKLNITSYKADPAQETAGDFCPKSVKYEIEDYPVIVILNSCPTKDRRIIRFDLTNPDLPTQRTNRFIRVPEIKQEDLMMCPDLETVIIAAPGTKTVLGIGYDTYNMIQDLSLGELAIKEVKKMVCLNGKAFGVGFLDVNNTFKIATYYTYKMRTADRKLHSVVAFPEIPDYVDFVGSEGNDIVYYNVFSSVPSKRSLKAIYLDGPLLFIQSDTRSIVNDAVIGTMNGYQTSEFNLMVSFVEQRSMVTVESRTSKVPINKRVYNMEELSIFKGPVFNFDYQSFSSNPMISFSPRVEPATEFVDTNEARTKGYLFASKVTDIGTTIDIVFTLIQKSDSSIVQIKHLNGGNNVTAKIDERCHQIKVLNSDRGYEIFLSCMVKSEYRFFFYLISKVNGDRITKRYSNIRSRATILEVARFDNKTSHLIGTIDDRDNLLLWSMDTDVSIGLDTFGLAQTYQVYSQEHVKNARVIQSAKRINVMFFKPSDSKARMVVVNPITSKVDRPEGFLIVVTTDESTIANFACRLQDGESGSTTCIFATNGPLVHRILFDENIAAGYVQKEKTSYYMFDDNYAIKTDFNREYITILARSPSQGTTNLLIYRCLENFGSQFLWSGVKVEDHTRRPPEDIDITLLENNMLLMTTNSKMGDSISLVKTFQLKNATINLKVPDLQELAKQPKLSINQGTNFQRSSVNLHHFFLTLAEQNSSAFKGASQWYHWVLMGLFFLAVYAAIAFHWHKEKLRNAKLKEDALHNNIAVEAEF